MISYDILYIWIWYTFIADVWFCNQVDYVRQLEPPRPYRSAEVDPGLWSSKEEIRAMAGYICGYIYHLVI